MYYYRQTRIQPNVVVSLISIRDSRRIIIINVLREIYNRYTYSPAQYLFLYYELEKYSL